MMSSKSTWSKATFRLAWPMNLRQVSEISKSCRRESARFSGGGSFLAVVERIWGVILPARVQSMFRRENIGMIWSLMLVRSLDEKLDLRSEAVSLSQSCVVARILNPFSMWSIEDSLLPLRNSMHVNKRQQTNGTKLELGLAWIRADRLLIALFHSFWASGLALT